MTASVREYLLMKWQMAKLTGLEGVSVFSGRVLALTLTLVVVNIAFLFLGFALSYWIGSLLDSDALGFIIVGGGFLLFGLILFLARKRLLVNCMVRFFVEMFFNERG